ncbi:hypothetical protein [Sphingosinicella sp. CPCC 101087]|uniref:hypothetical protein n=1 Tax=Sphingosinicella sp. CPCC 101087 TaxID=2497754 RepID=UPI00101D19A5|nr:hypothetical protein [Sphingosinicella sp. CPCC 101087]
MMAKDDFSDTDPAEAFERLRGEISLLHRAVEGLTAAREKTPDYSLTLGSMAQALAAIDARLSQIEASRALSLSPVEFAKEISAAAQAAQVEDRRIFGEARDALANSLGRIDGMIERGQAVEGRVRRERWIAVGGVLAGILLWSILPGAVVRSLPESWHAPEWMAARMMGVELAAATQRMIEAAEKADGRYGVHDGRKGDR